MKDLFLILILLATFAFGYYDVVRFGDFIEENQRLIAEGNRNSQCKIHIAAETPMLLNSIASALESYSESAPHVEFFLSSGQINRLLDKLINERIDILLLADDSTEPLGQQYASVLIPYEKTKMLVTTLGLTVENLDEEKWIRVVWKKSLKSKNRDRVITALEMEHCRLKCGYADYLD